MKKILLMLCFTTGFSAFAQNSPRQQQPYTAPAQETVSQQKPNALSLELLGRGGLYSLNYDRMVSDSFAVGGGLSYWGVSSVGVKKVRGTFKRGDVIGVKHKNRVIAVGITEFDFREMEKVMGKKSSEIQDLLQNAPSKVAIHKDNLLLKDDL